MYDGIKKEIKIMKFLLLNSRKYMHSLKILDYFCFILKLTGSVV
jgi:hypothetical protein